jgi:hypothetical protein
MTQTEAKVYTQARMMASDADLRRTIRDRILS